MQLLQLLQSNSRMNLFKWENKRKQKTYLRRKHLRHDLRVEELSTSRKVKEIVIQLCLILCDPMDYSPPSSSVHGILQVRILEWVAVPYSRRSSLSEPTGKPKNTGIGNLPLLLGIFMTQELNKSWSPPLNIDLLRAELPGKPNMKNKCQQS